MFAIYISLICLVDMTLNQSSYIGFPLIDFEKFYFENVDFLINSPNLNSQIILNALNGQVHGYIRYMIYYKVKK